MTSEDLPALASESFRLAQAFCGACRDYHATWTYVRAAGLRKGAIADLPFLKLGFEGLADSARVLIAGSADTGQLAAVAEALRGRRFSAMLVDLCETPLALCKGFARRHGIAFAADRRDIAEAAELGPFDAILFHNFLSFLDVEQRNATLATLRPTLGTDGRLVIFQRVVREGEADAGVINGDAVAAAVISRLRAAGIPLPEDEARFAERLAAAAANVKRERRLSAFTAIAELEGELRDAGYGDIRVTPLTEAASSMRERIWRPPSQRHLLVARAGVARPSP